MIAAGTGVGALVEGATVLGAGLGAVSVGTGFGAAVLDEKPCLEDHDPAACAGFGFGLGGAIAGTAGAAGAVGVLLGAWEEESLVNGILTGVGAFGLSLGTGGTAVDAGLAFGSSDCSSSP